MKSFLTALVGILGTLLAAYGTFLATDVNNELLVNLVEVDLKDTKYVRVSNVAPIETSHLLRALVGNRGPAVAKNVKLHFYQYAFGCLRDEQSEERPFIGTGSADANRPINIPIFPETTAVEFCIERDGSIPFERFVARGVASQHVGARCSTCNDLVDNAAIVSDERSMIGGRCKPKYEACKLPLPFQVR